MLTREKSDDHMLQINNHTVMDDSIMNHTRDHWTIRMRVTVMIAIILSYVKQILESLESRDHRTIWRNPILKIR